MLFFRYIQLLFLLILVKASFALTIPAGTLISNTAKIEYEDETGFKYKDFSNTVTIRVKQVYGVSLTPDFQSITSFPEKNISVSYVLKNTGNGRDKYHINVYNLADDDGDVENLKIYVDTNENGILDPGEQEYNNSNPPFIEKDGYIPLILVGKTPKNPSTGILKVKVSAFSLGNDQIFDTENILEIRVSPSFSVEISKDADKSEVLPGEDITFSVKVINTGTEDITGNDLLTDFDNDGSPETRKGIILEDEIPPYLSYEGSSKAPSNAVVLFKGDNDVYWKDDKGEITGKLKYIGLFIEKLLPDQQAKLEFTSKVDDLAPAEKIENIAVLKTFKGDINSNPVVVQIKEKSSIVLDDTDDNDAYTGSNRYTDNDDTMVIYSMTTGKGMYVEFLNEVWNLGNKPQVVNIFWDKGSSGNAKVVDQVIFYSVDGNPLIDTNEDGITDVGIVKPGERVFFKTRVYIQEGKGKDVIVAVKGVSEDGKSTDFTFDIIKDYQPATAVVDVTVSTGAGIGQEKLKKHRVVVYEFDQEGKRTEKPPIVLWTDDNGYILYDEEGNIKPLYNVLEDGKKYRMTIYGEYKNKTYYLSPFIKKEYFEAVENTGEEKCWDKAGNEVPCDNRRDVVKITVLNDGTKQMTLPLDPAGYVYDAVTNEKIMNACVYFYRCSDDSCTSYLLVDNDLLDYYSNPDLGRQTNPQLTSSAYGAGGGEGTFEFIFHSFVPSLRGWYFVEVDFECAGADKTLKDKYKPIRLKNSQVWVPTEGKPYTGEKFYIDEDFPGTILMIIPLGGPTTQNLVVQKSVSPSTASLGDFVEWSISVKNKGDTVVYDVNAYDYLPRGFRYKKGSAKVNGAPASDPEISGNGRVLTFNIGNIAPGETKTIKFYTTVISSATEGRHKNTADAQGWADTYHTTKITSNKGFAYIRIVKGIFSDKGYIFGKVFIDQNKNRIHDENEPVIKGAKIYLDNGRYAVTDVEGKYHFDNLNPRTYVIKIDKTSLPKGAKLVPLNTRNAGDPDTAFVDLYPGEMHKVNFALAPFNPELQVLQMKKKVKGKIKVERGIEEILVEPFTDRIKVKHYLLIENKSKEPFYELSYKEKSKAVPEKGTVYLNGAPFKDPELKDGYFKWDIPVLLPEEKLKITWISSVGRGVLKPRAQIGFKLTPTEKEIPLDVNIPVEFGVIKDKEYQVVVYFPFGSAQLTPEGEKTLMKVVEYLRKTNFKHLYIKIKGHTDAIRVVNPEIKSNTNLSLLRAETVKKFLKKHLIDLKRVEIK